MKIQNIITTVVNIKIIESLKILLFNRNMTKISKVGQQRMTELSHRKEIRL